MDILQNVMSAQEAGSRYGYTAHHIRLLADSGQIIGRKSGNRWIIYGPSVEDYIRRRIDGGKRAD